jgi:hypothetical protein
MKLTQMSEPSPYAIDFAPAARRGLARLPLPVATALHEHLTGPVAGNPHRLGKPLAVPTAVTPTGYGDMQPHPAAVSRTNRYPR